MHKYFLHLQNNTFMTKSNYLSFLVPFCIRLYTVETLYNWYNIDSQIRSPVSAEHTQLGTSSLLFETVLRIHLASFADNY